MKLKEIIGVIFMLLLTISGIILSFGIATKCVLNSHQIINIMKQVGYIEKSEQKAREVLGNYMIPEQAEEILKIVSTKSSTIKLAQAFDSNTVEEVANTVKDEMKQTVLKFLDEDVEQDVKEKFAIVVSDAYMKTIFPITEFNMISGIYEKYESKITLLLVIAAVVSVVVYIYLAVDKKIYKWAIIALYNIIILSIILMLILSSLNSIVIGNERTTEVIRTMLDKITINLIIGTIITFAVSAVSNYIAYFRKSNTRRKH